MFNKKEYDMKFRKEKYSRFLVDLPKDEKKELDELLKKHNISKADFLRWSIKKFKETKH